MPSTRLLAKNLAVSRSTVEMAYDQLLAEGYIQAEPCRGFFVCDIAELYRLRGSSVGETGQVHRPERPVCLVDFSPYAIDTTQFSVQRLAEDQPEMCCWTTVRNC